MNWVQELLALQKQYKMYPLVSFFAFINNDSSHVLLLLLSLLLTVIIMKLTSSRTVSRSKMTASLRSAILADSVSEDDKTPQIYKIISVSVYCRYVIGE